MIKKLKAKADALIEGIKEYSESQMDTWREIPSLALEADGRTGFSDSLALAYYDGYWRIESSIGRQGYYSVFVELETGSLVKEPSIKSSTPEKSGLLRLIAHLNELNAAEIKKCLKKSAECPYGSGYNAEDIKNHERQRERYRRLLMMDKSYTRKDKEMAKATGITLSNICCAFENPQMSGKYAITNDNPCYACLPESDFLKELCLQQSIFPNELMPRLNKAEAFGFWIKAEGHAIIGENKDAIKKAIKKLKERQI
ncbi:MAG: hypothetical protein PHO02_02950 [Candidatus Nanoarchaeia archaeon]|nr:hypothetical protein [Candidatus Nanoarchaeia archaeon]